MPVFLLLKSRFIYRKSGILKECCNHCSICAILFCYFSFFILKVLGGVFTDSNLIICQPNGKSFHPDHFAKKYCKLLKDHGLRKIRFYNFRHTNASLMIASEIDIKVAQQRLGHSDVITTLNIYSHVLERVNREAANTIDALIFKQSANL